MHKSLTIGTRGSPLALAQAHDVRDRLVAAHDDLTADQIEIRVIKTSGDRILDRSLMTAGGKGLFTKEIEEALLDGSIDLAVHSAKDMPTVLPDGLALAVFLPREDARDAFISPSSKSFADLPENAVMGTASLRRRAQALRQRPDLKLTMFRGNVGTRLKKLDAGEADATFLATAGLNRLKESDVITEKLDMDRFLPAPAQGIVTVECRDGDQRVRDYLAPLHDEAAAIAAYAERAFLAALDGSCRTPIAAHASVEGDQLTLRGEILSVDGQVTFEGVRSGATGDAAALGKDLGEALKAEAGPAFFEQLAIAAEELA